MKSKFIFCCLCVCCLANMKAQNHQADYLSNTRTNVFMEQMPFVSSLQEKGAPQRSITYSSVAIIRQIGSYNNINTNTTSNTSSLKYLQIGSANSIESYTSIHNSREQIIQYGNNNNVLNYSFGPVDSSNFNLVQSGNNQSFERFGTNNQTNNLSFILTGDNRSVIVRSY